MLCCTYCLVLCLPHTVPCALLRRTCSAHKACALLFDTVLHMLAATLCCTCCPVLCCAACAAMCPAVVACRLPCCAGHTACCAVLHVLPCAILCWPCCLPCCAGHAARRALLQALSCSLLCCTRCPVPCCPVLCCATCAACHTLLHMLPCCVTYDIKLYTATLVGQGFVFLVPCIEQV